MKSDLAKDIFTLFAILLLMLALYSVYHLHRNAQQIRHIESDTATQRLDSDLERIVSQLEADLVERYSLEFKTQVNPLQMTRVITFIPPALAKKEEERRREEERKRLEQLNAVEGFSLNATVVASSERTAVIRYKGNSYIVKEGDEIEGRKVLRIERERVILQQPNGRELVLLSRRAVQQSRTEER